MASSNSKLVSEYWDYAKQSWDQGQTVLSYQEWLEARIADLTAALTPFARFGLLKHPYAPEAVFTLVHDRDGHRVVIQFGDFIEAAKRIPGLALTSTDSEPVGAAGGIAEIMVGDPAAVLANAGLMEKPKFTYRVRWTSLDDGQERIAQTSANSETEALMRFFVGDLPVRASSAEILETVPFGTPFTSDEVIP